MRHMMKPALSMLFALSVGSLVACSSGDDDPPKKTSETSSVKMDAGATCPLAVPNSRGVGKACTKDGDCTNGTTCNLQAMPTYCSHSDGPSQTASCDKLSCGEKARCCFFTIPIEGVGKVATCIPDGCTPPDIATCL